MEPVNDEKELKALKLAEEPEPSVFFEEGRGQNLLAGMFLIAAQTGILFLFFVWFVPIVPVIVFTIASFFLTIYWWLDEVPVGWEAYAKFFKGKTGGIIPPGLWLVPWNGLVYELRKTSVKIITIQTTKPWKEISKDGVPLEIEFTSATYQRRGDWKVDYIDEEELQEDLIANVLSFTRRRIRENKRTISMGEKDIPAEDFLKEEELKTQMELQSFKLLSVRNGAITPTKEYSDAEQAILTTQFEIKSIVKRQANMNKMIGDIVSKRSELGSENYDKAAELLFTNLGQLERVHVTGNEDSLVKAAATATKKGSKKP